MLSLRDTATDDVALPTDHRAPPTDQSTELVEAATAEAAIAEVHRRHGERARIVGAEKVRRGGIGGFFAKEHVQLTVDTSDVAVQSSGSGSTPSGPPLTSDPSGPAAPAMPSREGLGLEQVDPTPSPLLAALADDDGPADETFGEMLDRRAGRTTPRPDGAPRPDGTPRPDGIGDAVDRLARATDDEEADFGAALRAAVAAGGSAAPLGHGAVARTPVPADAQERSSDAPGATVPATGTASLLDATDRAGAAPLTANAERVAASTTIVRRAPAQGTERPAATIVDAIGAALDASTEPRGRIADPGADLVDPDGAPPADPGPAPRDATTPPAAPDPLPSRHEALRQLRVAARRSEQSESQRTDGGSWSAEALAAAGVPDAVVAGVLAHSPSDDLEWFTAVAREVDALCRAPETSSAVVVGPDARRTAAVLGAPVVDLDDRDVPGGVCVLAGGRGPEARRWLAEERGGRSLHLVVGGVGWRDWLGERPSVVSWSDGDALLDALSAAVAVGATLGLDLTGDEPRRAQPLDVALAIRDRVVGS